MTNDDYTRITWPEVRKGDVLMHENGDRLTVLGVKPQHNGRNISVTSASLDLTSFGWAHRGWTAHRKVVTLPTTPGAYVDSDGKVWIRDDGWDGKPWIGQGYSDWQTPDEVSQRAPFTRLVPMPSREQVENLGLYGSDADAVLALLSGDDTTGGESND